MYVAWRMNENSEFSSGVLRQRKKHLRDLTSTGWHQHSLSRTHELPDVGNVKSRSFFKPVSTVTLLILFF